MKERIAHICAALTAARVFADIGCDHGYMTRYMLDNGLCERAYLSDVSAGSLRKAERLLERYIRAGSCIPVVADGLEGLPEPCDLVLIAGMGGEEIVSILSKFPLPARFVLQPMRNCEKVRRHLLARGARIERDETFSEGTARPKYYELIAGDGTGGDVYSEREFRYGRDNLRGASPAFLPMLREEAAKLAARLCCAAINERDRAALAARLKDIEETIHETERYL